MNRTKTTSSLNAYRYWCRLPGEEWQLIGLQSNDIAAALHFAKLREFKRARTKIELGSAAVVDDAKLPAKPNSRDVTSIVVRKTDLGFFVELAKSG